jgi:hypothetical protein
MIVPGSANALLLSQSGYTIPYALRFRAANSAYLSRSFGTPTSNIKWTWSGWIKRGALSTQILFDGGDGTSNNLFAVQFTSGDLIQVAQLAGGAYNVQMTTTAVFRDPSAWYHIVIVYDSANATSTDRVQIYVNNSRQTVSYSTGPFGASTACQWNVNARTHYLRRLDYSAVYGDMYSAEENFIDGQALTPSSFGQTDAATGVWTPKKYGGTYGNNGFYLKFADASAATAAAIGKDSSGNGNNWTPSGISVTAGTTFDQMTDTPTLGYAVMNPLDLSGTAATFQWGNLQVTRSGASLAQAYCSIQMSSGMWYCEMTAGADVLNLSPGIITGTTNAGANRYLGQDSFTYGYDISGQKVNNGTYSAYGLSWTSGDVIGIILDADNGKLYFSKNGTVQNSGDPVAGTGFAFSGLTGPYRFAVQVENGGIGDFNFGQRAFAYTPPSGFKALSTANISSTAVTTSGSFTGNAAADGPFIWANGNPATLTINGNAVTFGTHADKTAGGFKLRTSSASYNTSGSNSWTATAGKRFVQNKKPNNAQVNP